MWDPLWVLAKAEGSTIRCQSGLLLTSLLHSTSKTLELVALCGCGLGEGAPDSGKEVTPLKATSPHPVPRSQAVVGRQVGRESALFPGGLAGALSPFLYTGLACLLPPPHPGG